MGNKGITAKVHGKVQGVFFRASTEEKAKELQLTGFVQNEPDGTVYLEAEGTADALAHLTHWLHQGPPRAKVEKVEVREKKVLTGFSGFAQRR